MTRLIGSRWKRREAWSRGVLIIPISHAELCVAQSFVCNLCVFVYRNFECSVLVVWRRGHTRSHSEHGSQARSRRWYSSLQMGRVASRQNREFEHGTVLCGILEPMKQLINRRWFPIVIEKDEDGFFVAVNPSLTGCYSQGKTVEEALANVQEATELCLESADKDEVNRDTQVSVHLIAA